MIQLSPLDRLLGQIGDSLSVLAAARPADAASSPAKDVPEATLSDDERTLSARLMRVNHAGEIAAQGLYQGQALVARDPALRSHLKQAEKEEASHLDWCASRVSELGARTSYLDPAWYLGSVALGALASAAGDRISLGFIAETERQVVRHLDGHLLRLPENDQKSRVILEQMREDERLHGESAERAGGVPLPLPIPALMKGAARVMTGLSYWV